MTKEVTRRQWTKPEFKHLGQLKDVGKQGPGPNQGGTKS
jgi:hypothetical protein